jgi:integrase
MPLADSTVRTARAGKKPYKLSDGNGLYLLVNPNGSRYWRFKYRFHGKEKLLAVGVYPEIKAAQARAERDEARRMLRQGIDPSVDRQVRKQASVAAAGNTFEAIAREWVELQKNRWKPDHAAQVLHSLETKAFPDLGGRPIAAIAAPELLAVVRKVEARGALEAAQRLLQRSHAVFRFAIVTGRAERNPAADLRGALKAPKRTNLPALSAADLPEFLRKLEAYDGHLQTRLAAKLQLLTWVRPGELRAATWSEVDLSKALWEIPGERMKMGLPHVVPLSRQAVGVLEQLQALSGRGKLIFPSASRADVCMSENTVLFAMYRMGYHSRATAHGFRATASTIMNEQGWNPDAIERQLAHVEKNKIRGAYNRAQYIEERRKMMQAWADYLDARGLHHA